eukprot:4759099-Prymnesium_polylepis.3
MPRSAAIRNASAPTTLPLWSRSATLKPTTSGHCGSSNHSHSGAGVCVRSRARRSRVWDVTFSSKNEWSSEVFLMESYQLHRNLCSRRTSNSAASCRPAWSASNRAERPPAVDSLA